MIPAPIPNVRTRKHGIAMLSLLISISAATVGHSKADVSANDQVETGRDALSATHAEKLQQSPRSLNLSRASILALHSDLDADTILKLHDAGKSWRQIAEDLSLHPSLIGIEIVDPRPPSFVRPTPSVESADGP